MTVKQRITAIRLMEMQEKQPDCAEQLGLKVVMLVDGKAVDTPGDGKETGYSPKMENKML
jgi:hypothetical protein